MGGTVEVIVPNIVEFNLRWIGAVLDPRSVASYVTVGAVLADESVFWSTGPRVQLLHPGVDAEWWADVHEWLGEAAPPLVTPAGTGRLVADLLTDPGALRSLQSEVDGYDRVELRCWGAGPEIYRLAATVGGWGHEVVLDVPAPEAYWTSLYLESKTSCADLAARLSGLRVPPTSTVTTWAELTGAVEALVRLGRPAIVKAPHGVGGIGATVLDPGADPEPFWRNVGAEQLLHRFPVLVQEFVAHQPGVGCPATDLLVEERGVTDIVNSVLTVDGHRLRSVKVGAGILPSAVDDATTAVGHLVGAEAARMGYRGWLGVDCVLGRDGVLYATEVNARRTGGMHLIALARRWGVDGTTVRCESMLPVTSGYPHLRRVFQKLWDEGARALPTTVRGLGRARPTLGLITVGASPAESDAVAVEFGRRSG